MLLFITTVLPFLAHDHASAAAFLTCRHHNFHASIIPEFLSDEPRVGSFCNARQRNELKGDGLTEYASLYNLFVQTPLMQFSPSLIVFHKDCVESILKPLLQTKYFTRTLQRCSVGVDVPLTSDLFHSLSTVQSLTKLDLIGLQNQHLEIIVHSCPSLETFNIGNAASLDPTTAISIASPRPPATKTLRNLTLKNADALFATQFVPHFINLRKLELSPKSSYQELDLRPLSPSLSVLTDLSILRFSLQNIESLKNLVHLSALHFYKCRSLELSFLDEYNCLPQLTTLRISGCDGLYDESSFESLENAPNLQVLQVIDASEFNNDSLEYLENLSNLRKLDLTRTRIAGDSRSLQTLMGNLFQLEELYLDGCRDIGNQCVLTEALSSTYSSLRVLTLRDSNLEDDDLSGIGAFGRSLEVLDLGGNYELTNRALVYCEDLVKLKILKLENAGINDLSPLKGCLNLEELNVSGCDGLTSNSFKVFSKEPNSFPNLSVLDLFKCDELTGKVFKHLANNNYLVYQLKELNVGGLSGILLSSETARNNLYRLKGLRKVNGILPDDDYSSESPSDDDSSESAVESEEQLYDLEDELLRNLTNLDEIN